MSRRSACNSLALWHPPAQQSDWQSDTHHLGAISVSEKRKIINLQNGRVAVTLGGRECLVCVSTGTARCAAHNKATPRAYTRGGCFSSKRRGALPGAASDWRGMQVPRKMFAPTQLVRVLRRKNLQEGNIKVRYLPSTPVHLHHHPCYHYSPRGKPELFTPYPITLA